MFKNLSFLLTLLFFGITVSISSCSKDSDGDDPEPTIDVSVLLGNWTALDDCFDSETFTIKISKGTENGEIIIDNVTNLLTESQVTATVNADEKSFTIPSQDDGGVTISGSGSVDGDYINLDLSVTDVLGTDDCSVIGFKVGATPPDPTRDNYIASWSGYAECDLSPGVSGSTTTTSISAGTSANEVIINNVFYDGPGFLDLNATVDGKTITIPEQQSGEYTISGTGTLSSSSTFIYDMISITYNIERNVSGTIATQECEYSAEKQ